MYGIKYLCKTCAKNVGGEGGVFVGHYGMWLLKVTFVRSILTTTGKIRKHFGMCRLYKNICYHSSVTLQITLLLFLATMAQHIEEE